MTTNSILRSIFDAARRETERSIASLEEQVQDLNEQIRYKRSLEEKFDQKLYDDSVRLFMRTFLTLPNEEQTDILDSFRRELSLDPLDADVNEKRQVDLATQILLDDYREAPHTPDLCEGDLITDVGQCFITKKPKFDEEEYREIVLPVLEEQLFVNDNGFLHAFGRDYGVPVNKLEEQALGYLTVVGSYNVKNMARIVLLPGQDVPDDDPRVRHDLWLIAVESLRKKLIEAMNGAIQLEYYIYRDDLYSYDERIPYEAVYVRLRKAGPLDSNQERKYLSLYESTKRFNFGT